MSLFAYLDWAREKQPFTALSMTSKMKRNIETAFDNGKLEQVGGARLSLRIAERQLTHENFSSSRHRECTESLASALG